MVQNFAWGFAEKINRYMRKEICKFFTYCFSWDYLDLF